MSALITGGMVVYFIAGQSHLNRYGACLSDERAICIHAMKRYSLHRSPVLQSYTVGVDNENDNILQ
jgi:hypothetical protein